MRREPTPRGLQALTELPPPGWRFVLRRPQWRPDRPYKTRFYNWVAWTRTVEHPDGETMATHFVYTDAERLSLFHKGWDDVTDMWAAVYDLETGERLPEPQEAEEGPDKGEEGPDKGGDPGEPTAASDEPREAGLTPEAVAVMSYADLKVELKGRGLRTNGTTGDLRARLTAALQEG